MSMPCIGRMSFSLELGTQTFMFMVGLCQCPVSGSCLFHTHKGEPIEGEEKCVNALYRAHVFFTDYRIRGF